MLETEENVFIQVELTHRLSIINSAELIVKSMPKKNRDVNDHYTCFVHFLETLMFTTASELKETDDNKEPVKTSYNDLIKVITEMQMQIKDQIIQRKIVTHEEYHVCVEKSINVALTKWMNYRNIVSPLKREEVE